MYFSPTVWKGWLSRLLTQAGMPIRGLWASSFMTAPKAIENAQDLGLFGRPVTPASLSAKPCSLS
jgi:hypothetical protein